MQVQSLIVSAETLILEWGVLVRESVRLAEAIRSKTVFVENIAEDDSNAKSALAARNEFEKFAKKIQEAMKAVQQIRAVKESGALSKDEINRPADMLGWCDELGLVTTIDDILAALSPEEMLDAYQAKFEEALESIEDQIALKKEEYEKAKKEAEEKLACLKEEQKKFQRRREEWLKEHCSDIQHAIESGATLPDSLLCAYRVQFPAYRESPILRLGEKPARPASTKKREKKKKARAKSGSAKSVAESTRQDSRPWKIYFLTDRSLSAHSFENEDDLKRCFREYGEIPRDSLVESFTEDLSLMVEASPVERRVSWRFRMRESDGTAWHIVSHGTYRMLTHIDDNSRVAQVSIGHKRKPFEDLGM